MKAPNVWVLLCARTGADNQALALAEELGFPYQRKLIRHNRLRRLAPWLGKSLLTVQKTSRRKLGPPWPDIIIAVSRSNVPPARWIKEASGGRAKTVFLGNPRVRPQHLDLIITTCDYLLPRRPNVLTLPLPVSSINVTKGPLADRATDFPGPRMLFLLGGPVKHFTLSLASISEAVRTLSERANRQGGTLLISGSPRTPDAWMVEAKKTLRHATNGYLAPSRTGGVGTLLESADEVFVTGDSMAMVTEAIHAGKPVGIVSLDMTVSGRRKLGKRPVSDESGSSRRDLRRFWTRLWTLGLAGTLDEPKSGRISPSVKCAGQAVKRLIDPNHINAHIRAK